jgi:hypothetical protein
VQRSTKAKNFCKAPYEDRALFVGEGVEQPAVDHGVQPPPQLVQFQSIADDESGFTPSLSRFGLVPFDGERREVDAPGFVALSCQIQQVFAGAAAHVEYAATNLTCFS